MSVFRSRLAATRPIRFGILGLGLLLILAGGYALWWHSLTNTLRVELEHWIDERAAAGWKISTGVVTVEGFPFRIVLSLSAPVVEDPSGNVWKGPPLAVVLPLLSPQHPHFDAAGRHDFSLKGYEPISLVAQAASVELAFDGHGLTEASLAMSSASAGSFGLGRMDLQWNRQAVGHVAQDVTSWSMQLALQNITLPDDSRLLFGPLLPSVRLESHLRGSLPGGPLDQALTAWRDDGGTLEIDLLSIDWPPLALSGKGTLALDHALQPELGSSCDVHGLFEAIDALTRGGMVRAKDARLAKLVFGLLMKPDKNGAIALTVPVTIQNRVLSVGPVKLFEVPVLAWRK
jgi:hypothetical protein